MRPKVNWSKITIWDIHKKANTYEMFVGVLAMTLMQLSGNS